MITSFLSPFNPSTPMYPHVKLDWHISRLEKRLEATPDDTATRLEYAVHCLSRAQFHGGGEAWFNRALTQARRVLQHDPTSPGAMTVTGISLVGLDRPEPASRSLDESLRAAPDRAEVHLGLGMLYQQTSDRHRAVREMEMACRLDPDSWEANYLLGQVLAERAEELGAPSRMLERSQYHTVRALRLGPSSALMSSMLYHLAANCLRTGRPNEAYKIFSRLLESDSHKSKARYHLGIVSYNLGKYKNSILFLRQHLKEVPENPHVYARIGMAYLLLGEVAKAREACNRALAVEPEHLLARWTLGCAMLEEGRTEDAIDVFKGILDDAPDHLQAFSELVLIRQRERDRRWLVNALRAEVAIHDRLPVHGHREDPTTGRRIPINPRAATRERISTVLNALASIDDQAATTILATKNLTTDEGLGFFLWEKALEHVASLRAKGAATKLETPGLSYSASLGREVLTLSSALAEDALKKGLYVSEEDLKRAAVDRHGPTHDVSTHRAAIEKERQQARAWQSLLLIAIATRESSTARNLLLSFESNADQELAAAARAGLTMLGDTNATDNLRQLARQQNSERFVDALLSELSTPEVRFHPRPVSDDEDLHCSTCGRRSTEVDHMMTGGAAVICDQCMTIVARDRRELSTDDPHKTCGLCGNTSLDSRALYNYNAVCVCADCIDNSLGLLEREEVDRYLASW
ncbi:MAG: tetratricopeptide repeat protein [Proteobacteria bacterium]|nr:tetratricopeptide repeat protein [Pseudomonadota bacterium]